MVDEHRAQDIAARRDQTLGRNLPIAIEDTLELAVEILDGVGAQLTEEMAGFDTLIERLTAHDYRRGLASTSSRDWVDFIVNGLAVRPHFHAIVAGDDGIHWNAVQASARLVKYLEENSPHSQGNFSFAATAFLRYRCVVNPSKKHRAGNQA